MNDTAIHSITAAPAPEAQTAAETERLTEARQILCAALKAQGIDRVDGTLRFDGETFVVTDLCAFTEGNQPAVFNTSGPIAVGADDQRRSYPSLQAFIGDHICDQLRNDHQEFLTDGTLSFHASYLKQPIDWAARFAAEDKQRLAELQPRKLALVEALRKLGIASVVAVYDGAGDSGQIESIAAYTADGSEITIKGQIIVADAPPEPMEEVLDAFCWDCLVAYHQGFENNEGGYGEITIEIATRKVTIDHNDRIIEVDNTVSEI